MTKEQQLNAIANMLESLRNTDDETIAKVLIDIDRSEDIAIDRSNSNEQ